MTKHFITQKIKPLIILIFISLIVLFASYILIVHYGQNFKFLEFLNDLYFEISKQNSTLIEHYDIANMYISIMGIIFLTYSIFKVEDIFNTNINDPIYSWTISRKEIVSKKLIIERVFIFVVEFISFIIIAIFSRSYNISISSIISSYLFVFIITNLNLSVLNFLFMYKKTPYTSIIKVLLSVLFIVLLLTLIPYISQIKTNLIILYLFLFIMLNYIICAILDYFSIKKYLLTDLK